MNRRDTIIIALLINAGLMVMLFISALKNDVKEDHVAKATPNDYQRPQKSPVPKEAAIEKIKPAIADVVIKSPEINTAKKTLEKEFVALQKDVVHPDNINKADHKTQREISKTDSVKPQVSQINFLEYTVKKGDVLEKIAKNYQTSVEEIIRTNKLSNTNLQIGQVLKLPKSHEKKAPQAEPVNPKDFYIVKNGDNLWKIALEHHLKVEDLLKLNQLDEKKAKALRPGDQLRIR